MGGKLKEKTTLYLSRVLGCQSSSNVPYISSTSLWALLEGRNTILPKDYPHLMYWWWWWCCLARQSKISHWFNWVETRWLRKPLHVSHINFILIKPFSDPSCPMDGGSVILFFYSFVFPLICHSSVLTLRLEDHCCHSYNNNQQNKSGEGCVFFISVRVPQCLTLLLLCSHHYYWYQLLYRFTTLSISCTCQTAACTPKNAKETALEFWVSQDSFTYQSHRRHMLVSLLACGYYSRFLLNLQRCKFD